MVKSAATWIACLMGAALLLLAGVVAVRAQAIDLPVPRITIYPGDAIAADLLSDRAFVASTVNQAAVFVGRDNLVGKVARRTLLPGQPVPVNGVRDPYVVTQGKPALVMFEQGTLTITAQAIALQSGGVGDMVSLRNPDSGIVIRGTVQRDGTIRVEAP